MQYLTKDSYTTEDHHEFLIHYSSICKRLELKDKGKLGPAEVNALLMEIEDLKFLSKKMQARLRRGSIRRIK